MPQELHWLGSASGNPKDKQGLGTWLPAFESLLWCKKSIVAHKHASFKTEKAEDMLVGGLSSPWWWDLSFWNCTKVDKIRR